MQNHRRLFPLFYDDAAVLAMDDEFAADADGIFINLFPLRLCAVIQNLKILATMERAATYFRQTAAYVFHAARNHHACKRRTALERALANFRHAVRNGYAFE